MNDKIQKAIYSLLQTEPYFAHFILGCRIVYDHPKVKTAAVAICQGNLHLIFDREFIKDFTPEQMAAVLKHEVLHLNLDHLSSTKGDGLDPYIANLAQDCVINQYINHLPDGGVTLASLSKLVGFTLPPNQIHRYYYDRLIEKKEELEKGGAKTLDDHNPDIEGQDSEALAKGAVLRTAKQALASAAGVAPQYIVSQISAAGESKLPWKQLLRNFIFSQTTSETKSTHKKINRRFSLPIPGKRRKRTLVLGVCLDSSGSVSNEQYALFLDEVESIAKQTTKTYLIDADSVVHSAEEIKGKKVDRTRKGCGGTAYQPAIDKCVELKCDVIIYFGDGDTSDMPRAPHVPFIWVLVGNQNAPGNFGKVLRLS